MKKLLLSLALISGATQQTNTMFQAARNASKKAFQSVKSKASKIWPGVKFVGQTAGLFSAARGVAQIYHQDQELILRNNRNDLDEIKRIVNENQRTGNIPKDISAQRLEDMQNIEKLYSTILEVAKKLGVKKEVLINTIGTTGKYFGAANSRSNQECEIQMEIGAVRYFANRPVAFRAWLLHEFTHVKNNDSDMNNKLKASMYSSMGLLALMPRPLTLGITVASVCTNRFHSYLKEFRADGGACENGTIEEVSKLIEDLETGLGDGSQPPPGPLQLDLNNPTMCYPSGDKRISRFEERKRFLSFNQKLDLQIEETQKILDRRAAEGSKLVDGTKKVLERLKKEKAFAQEKWEHRDTFARRATEDVCGEEFAARCFDC